MLAGPTIASLAAVLCVVALFALVSNALTPIRNLLTKSYELNEINEAIQDFETGQIFRPILEMRH